MSDIQSGNTSWYSTRLTLELIALSIVVGLLNVFLATFNSLLVMLLGGVFSLFLTLLAILNQVNTLVNEKLERYHQEVHDENLYEPNVKEREKEWNEGNQGARKGDADDFKHRKIAERGRGTYVEVSDGNEQANFFVDDGTITCESQAVRQRLEDSWLEDAKVHLRESNDFETQ